MILTRKSHNCAGTAFVQGDSAGGSKLIEQTIQVVESTMNARVNGLYWIHFYFELRVLK